MANHYQDEAWVINLIKTAMKPPSSSSPRIPRVPKILVTKKGDIYEKYYVPQAVSIGPYHYGNPKLESVEKLKPCFTEKLLTQSKCNINVGLSSLYKKLGEANMVKELREFYEERSTDHLSDKEFTMMMLLDGCFILYYIRYIYGERAESFSNLRSHQTLLIHQDLFLLENQIPFKVVKEVLDLIKLDHVDDKVRSFFADNFLSPGKQKRELFCSGGSSTQRQESHGSFEFVGHDHLLHRLHTGLTGPSTKNESRMDEIKTSRCTFLRNVSELADAGIRFMPSSVMSLAHVEFVGTWWKFEGYIKLPPIIVDDSTKRMLLNLIAYEMCSDDAHAWVTSYISLLDSLINHPEDVKALRNAGVLDHSLGSDEEVVTLFNEIGTGLVPNNLAYSKAMYQIQNHYHSSSNRVFTDIKRKYIINRISVVTVTALLLTAVQTYYSIPSSFRK